MSSKQLFLINHLTTVLTNYIQSNDALYSHFKHHNQKYSIYDLTYWIIYSSIINISIYKLPKSSINMSHSILYKFNYKLHKFLHKRLKKRLIYFYFFKNNNKK